MTGLPADRLLFTGKNRADILTIAHRGASAYFPENTMSAFEGAVAQQADMIELDVQLSKDGVPVVFHDDFLKRHSNGRGRVRNFRLSELKALDVGSWFNKKFSDQSIPTLEEVLDFASGTIALNIEIKPISVTNQLEGGVEEKVEKLVKKYGMQHHVLFSSFDYRVARRFKKLDQSLFVGLLFNKKKSAQKRPSQLIEQFGADAFHCSYRELTAMRLQDLKKHNIPILVYTIDGRRRMQKLIKVGVHGIFTNKPDVLREVIADKKVR